MLWDTKFPDILTFEKIKDEITGASPVFFEDVREVKVNMPRNIFTPGRTVKCHQDRHAL